MNVNLRNDPTRNTIIHCHHFENEHHFEFESIKNEFYDLENLLKHVLHIEILQNMRYIYIHNFIFHGGHFEKWLPV